MTAFSNASVGKLFSRSVLYFVSGKSSEMFKIQRPVTSKILPWSRIYRNYSNIPGDVDTQNLIQKYTMVSTNHLTPVLKLHLITPDCYLWNCDIDDCPFDDPYWAFYWPGGQSLTRFILDNPGMFHGKSVLDVGCGCGASSIAIAMVGASVVLANDIDPIATTAVKLNAELNKVLLNTSSDNLVGCHDQYWDIVLLGDMFYDKQFSNLLADWLKELAAKGTQILVGDPGRVYLKDHPIKNNLSKLMEYELTEQCKRENNGLSYGYVWQFQKFSPVLRS